MEIRRGELALTDLRCAVCLLQAAQMHAPNAVLSTLSGQSSLTLID